MSVPTAPLPRPRLRGVLHQYAFVASLLAGAVLVAAADGQREIVSASIFTATLAAMFGTSAVYHRITWRPGVRRWMRRADHAAIYLLIAGTYTPFGLLVLDGAWQVSILTIVWSGCLGAIVLKFLWVDGPAWVSAIAGIALGWIGVLVVPQIVDAAGFGAVALLAVGGLLYTAGALVYALRRPDPMPTVFGYHELFHALVVAAAVFQYAAVAIFVLDAG
jgi:hemolysin III